MKEADKKQTCFTVNVISNNLKSKFKFLLQKKGKEEDQQTCIPQESDSWNNQGNKIKSKLLLIWQLCIAGKAGLWRALYPEKIKNASLFPFSLRSLSKSLSI